MSEGKKHEVAVILINYNSGEYTKSCIDSILSHTAKTLDFQIVVIDNASEYADYQELKSYCDQQSFENLKLVRNDINVGFGAGNMLGVHYANADYLAFINNDSFFTTDCLSIILNAMKSDPKLGVCGPLAHNENGKLLPTLDHFASPVKEILGRKFLETINPAVYPKRKKLYTAPKRAQFISGSFMVVAAADFNAVGGFDTNIFLYYEETDLCKRLAKIDKFAYLIPDAKFIHYHGVSTPKSTAIKIELKISLLYVIRKHYGFLAYKFMVVYLSVRYFFSSIFKPKYWKLFYILLLGAPLSKSLKTRQRIKA